MPQLRPLVAIGLLLGLALPGLAAPAALNQGVPPTPLETLLPGAEFAPGLPTLRDVTGVDPAERPLRPDEVLDWFKALAEASPRARLIEFARTHEGRPLVYLAVSDEATIADLDGFRRAHLERWTRAGSPERAAAIVRRQGGGLDGLRHPRRRAEQRRCRRGPGLLAGGRRGRRGRRPCGATC